MTQTGPPVERMLWLTNPDDDDAYDDDDGDQLTASTL